MSELRTGDFDYHLPRELIAARPAPERGEARMLVLDRVTGSIRHDRFQALPDYLQPGDLAVLNDTKVLPARFFSNDRRIEVLRLDFGNPLRWRCLVRPGKRMRLGCRIAIGNTTGTVRDILPDGERILVFDRSPDPNRDGSLALPHYLGRESDVSDSERYQTVFAREEGAIAAPTAGLHFPVQVLAALPHTFLTLHVGIGTFQPVRAERPSQHRMHTEWFRLPEAAAQNIREASRVLAVGTTVARVLEHTAATGGIRSIEGETNIFIYPPYTFRAVDLLFTNFHLPKSTLLMLVSAFAGRESILEAYREAVRQRYRFYSYGDCMLIL
ncbi:MAG TPA: tRNA preQ1(34) S-adenosylmethionine ribosyltransferase-isomerase QueA [Verrucomicrobiales bacterium]|nr:tRNA preQ1(34) S-adenosylmethionine ribosyltransferase-isomerase QueA [Verrucomicrobiales bacterium]